MVSGGPALALAHHAGTGAAHDGSTTAVGTISTLAGGVGGPGTGTKISLALGAPTLSTVGPCAVSYGAGSVYIATTYAVRKLNPATDHLTTPAGTGAAAPLGDGGPATAASIDGACGAAADHSGNLVIGDGGGNDTAVFNRVRVVAASTGTFYGRAMTAGHIYTVAGTGINGFSGDGGPATAAELSDPAGVAVDGSGNLVIADADNDRIRVVAAHTGTFYGIPMTAGDIYTVAGGGDIGLGDGGPATQAELGVQAVSVDGAGNLVMADSRFDRVRVVAASTGTFYGRAMTAGDIYSIAGNGTAGFAGDGGPAGGAELNAPQAAALDSAGNVLIADAGNQRIRVIAEGTGTFYGQSMTANHIYTIAGTGTPGLSGDGGPATSAELHEPSSVAVDGAGDVVIADTANFRVRVIAASTGTHYGRAMTAGHIYTVAGIGSGHFSGNGTTATAAQLDGPQATAADSAGDVVISDGTNRIRMVAATTGTHFGVAMTAGHIYTVAGDGNRGFGGDNGPALKAKVEPRGIAFDSSGNLVFADGSNRIRVVAARTGTFYGKSMKAGYIYSIAGGGSGGVTNGIPAVDSSLTFPTDVAIDGAGNVLIVDNGDLLVRVVAEGTGTFYGQSMTAGDIYTIAGGGPTGALGDDGPATDAYLNGPRDVAVDPAGNVVISDTNDERIRVVAANTGTFYGIPMTAEDIYTVAGNGNHGHSGDGGPATSARLNTPLGVAVDGAGNLVIADNGNSRIRVVAASTGTFYGIPMTADDIYTVTGDGAVGFHGDHGPAAKARIDQPFGVAVDGGNLLIADTFNNRVREVTGG